MSPSAPRRIRTLPEARTARSSHGSWSRPTRTSTSARARRARCEGLISTAWGSPEGEERLSTAMRPPPTASARAARSVEVATTRSGGGAATQIAAAHHSAPHAHATARLTTLALLAVGEDRLRDHAVHALPHVDHLRDAAVAHHRDDRVRLVAVERHHLLRGEPVHRLAHRFHHRLVEVLVEAHEDPVRLRLRTRPFDLEVLAHDGLDADLLVRALERGEVHLAVALAAMRVAGPDERALQEHRDEQ